MKQQTKMFMVLVVSILASHSLACSIQMEQILSMDEGSALVFEITDFPVPPTVMPLEGGTIMNIDIGINLFHLLFGNVDGDVTVGELLFATPPFLFLGLPEGATEEVCVVLDENNPSPPGSFEANIFGGSATFDVTLNTIALIGNPVLASVLPGGGFAFPFALQSTIPMSLGDMLGMLTGSGNLSVEQELDMAIVIEVDPDGPGGADPTLINANVGGVVGLSSVDAFPSSPLLDDCIAFLNE